MDHVRNKRPRISKMPLSLSDIIVRRFIKRFCVLRTIYHFNLIALDKLLTPPHTISSSADDPYKESVLFCRANNFSKSFVDFVSLASNRLLLLSFPNLAIPSLKVMFLWYIRVFGSNVCLFLTCAFVMIHFEYKPLPPSTAMV